MVYRAELALLRQKGHKVVEYTDHNRRILKMKGLSLAIEAIWSRNSRKQVDVILEQFTPHVGGYSSGTILTITKGRLNTIGTA